jgi:hypothetical protein
VQGIDISIVDCTLHALIGPNGAGKTTAFNLLSGMFPPDQGTVSLLGQPIAGETPEEIARAGIGRSFQITNLFPTLSVGENIRLAVQARHPRRFDPVTNALSIEAINAETDATIRYLGLAGIERPKRATCPMVANAFSTWAWRSPPHRACCYWTNRWRGLPRRSASGSVPLSSASRRICQCCWSSTTSTGCFSWRIISRS